MKTTLTHSKTVYAAVCISELIKLPMYEVPDHCTKNKFGNKSRLFFADTNNLEYKTETKC